MAIHFRDLSLGVKQAAGFGFIVCVMAAVSGFLVHQVAQLKTEIDDLNNERLPRILATFDLSLDIAVLRTSQLQHAVSRDARHQARQAEIMVGLIDSIDAKHLRLESIRQAAGPPSAEESALHYAFVDKWESFQDVALEIIQLSIANQDEGAVKLLEGDGRRSYEEIDEAAAALVNHTTQDFVEATRQAEQTYAATRKIMVASLVATVIASLVAGIGVVSLVARPVGELARAANRVAQGDLDVALESRSNDEVGRLTGSFNDMTLALRRARQESEALSQRNLEQERALRLQAERELDTARRLQLGLMPTSNPTLEGFDIAGRCLPAQQVGGDFFQYFARPDGRLAISLVDVAGHAMEAAIPVVLFSGILESEMARAEDVGDLFTHLNRTLFRVLDRHIFVCCLMAEVDPQTRRLRLGNSGCPYPLHYSAADGQVRDIALDAYPLGSVAGSTYTAVDVQLEPGDRVILCSDGIVEAMDSDQRLFGFERTAAATAHACAAGGSATRIIDSLLASVQTHTGSATQHDDQTIVAMAVS